MGTTNSAGWATHSVSGGSVNHRLVVHARVISPDHPRAAQLQPGDSVTFTVASLAEAEAALLNQWSRIDETLPGVLSR
jgi:allophanate hydrolase subunit 2